MTSSVSTDRVQREDSPVGEFRTYSHWDADSEVHNHAYAQTIMDDCYVARRAQRARTHRRITQVRDITVRISALGVGLTVASVLLVTLGRSSVIAMQIGALLAGFYMGGNDVRKSIASKDPAWRERHKIISGLVRQHPLD